MKKITFLSVLLIIALLLAGCGNTETTDEGSSPSVDTSAVASSTDTVPEVILTSSDTSDVSEATVDLPVSSAESTLSQVASSKVTSSKAASSKATSSKSGSKKKTTVDNLEGITTLRADAEASVPSDLKTMQNEVLSILNSERKKAGKAELKLEYYFFPYAEIRAEEAKTLWSHTRPSGGYFDTVYDDIKDTVDYGSCGENLAKLFRTAEQAMTALMNSTDHKENILRDEFTKVSICILPLEDYPGYYIMSQMFFGK